MKPWSKVEFRQRLKTRLARDLGMAHVPNGGGSAAWDLLYRREDDALVLTVGTELSAYEPDLFTCSAYLAPSFRWAYSPKGFPRDAYARLGSFLHSQERVRLLPADFSAAGVVDAWWRGFSEEALDACCQAATICVPRFLAQPGLFDRVRSSEPLQRHAQMLTEIRELQATLRTELEGLKHQPKKPIAGVPSAWCWAAEVVASRRRPDIVKATYVELLARDAYLMATLP